MLNRFLVRYIGFQQQHEKAGARDSRYGCGQ
jgi:hypothetical protein